MNPYGEGTLEDETTPRGCAGNKRTVELGLFELAFWGGMRYERLWNIQVVTIISFPQLLKSGRHLQIHKRSDNGSDN